MSIVILVLISIIIWLYIKSYKTTAYYQITKNSFLKTRLDLGRNGEYLTYKKLQSFEKDGARFLFNCYLPRENNTTEIDVLMIHKSGIYVFESKNYSGWIFGSEQAKTWTQVLPTGKGRSQKEHFLNPIMQNKLHIKYLKNLISDDIPVHSVVVFSERCTLKKVDVQSSDIHVIQRMNVRDCVEQLAHSYDTALSEDRIKEIYEKIYPYSQTDETVKIAHVGAIREQLKKEVQGGTEEINKIGDSEVAVRIAVEEVISTDESFERKEEVDIICPKCGKELVMRTVKRGANVGKQFYGCSGYPACKYIQNL